MNAFALSGLLTAIGCTVMAGLVYFSNRTHRVNQLWAVFCLAVSVWGLGVMLIGQTPDPRGAIIWWRVAHLGAILVPILFYHFVVVFTRIARPRLVRIGYLAAGAFLVLDATPWFITGVRYMFGQFYYNASGSNPVYWLYIAFFFVWIVLSHVELWRYVRRIPAGGEHLHAEWLLFGTALGFAGGATCFLPVFGIDVYPNGNFLVPLFPLVMTYAILRYRLIALDLALIRGVSFLVIYAVVVGLPLLSGRQYKSLWQTALGDLWWIGPTVLMGLLASVGPWVYIAIQKKAEARLLGERRGYQRILWQASQGMTQIRDLERLLRLVVHVITKTVGLTNAEIFLEEAGGDAFALRAVRYRSRATTLVCMSQHDPLVQLLKETRQPVVLDLLKMQASDSPSKNGQINVAAQAVDRMEALRATMLVPSFSQEKLIGFVALGEKHNGQSYTAEDVVVFSTLANQAALAIENARFYEGERQRQAALFHAASLASLGTMASSMGHQVNNRFNVVSVIASTQKLKLKELLQRDGQDTESLRKALLDCLNQFDSLQEEAVRGGQIFSAIRKIARPSTEGHRPVSMKAAIKAGVDIVQYKVRLDQLDFQVDVPEDLPDIMGDMAQLGECFLNLIDNANDAIKIKEQQLKLSNYRGSVKIGARTQEIGGKLWLIVQVADDGIGMTEKEREHLFVPFFTTKATAEKGTGLGLYVIMKIMEVHKGVIEVLSTYEVGSTFIMRFPAIRPGSARAAAAPSSTAKVRA